MANPAFLVEGRMEQKIIQRLCPGQPTRLIGVNGDHVRIEAICDRVETHIRIFGNRYYPIFVIFDRENRTESALIISGDCQDILNSRGLGDQDIRIIVADRVSEDWLLLDKESICQHYNIPLPARILRGKGGLALLVEDRVQYHETSVGVELFSVVSKQKISDSCPMFSKLYNGALEIGCLAISEPLV